MSLRLVLLGAMGEAIALEKSSIPSDSYSNGLWKAFCWS